MSSIWRFYDRHEINFKKSLARDGGDDQDGSALRSRACRESGLRPLEDANARAELRVDGVTAPYVIDGAMDGPAFLAYVEQMLAA